MTTNLHSRNIIALLKIVGRGMLEAGEKRKGEGEGDCKTSATIKRPYWLVRTSLYYYWSNPNSISSHEQWQRQQPTTESTKWVFKLTGNLGLKTTQQKSSNYMSSHEQWIFDAWCISQNTSEEKKTTQQAQPLKDHYWCTQWRYLFIIQAVEQQGNFDPVTADGRAGSARLAKICSTRCESAF